MRLSMKLVSGFGVVLSSWALVACMGTTSASGSGSSRSYTGAVTVQNASSHPVCRVDLVLRGTTRGFASHDLSGSPLAPGASTQVNATSEVDTWLVHGCDGQVLFAASADTRPTVVLRDGQWGRRGREGDATVIQVEPIAVSELVPSDQLGDEEVRASTLTAIQQWAERENWRETMEASVVTDTEWSIVRHRLTGIPVARRINAWAYARWPAGYCTFQQFSYLQQHDGSDFNGQLRREGTGPQFSVPCEAIEVARSNGGTGRNVLRGRFLTNN